LSSATADALLARLAGGADLTAEEAEGVLLPVLDGEMPEERVALLLTAWQEKGPTADEVAGAAAAMRARMNRLPTKRTDAVDTCGTGGSGCDTFNISTAAAIIVAACGVPVAKHGNRKATSKSGSADVLEALGVHLDLSLERAGECLDELGICFCFARKFHPAMRHVANVRQALPFPTIFNLLGPLASPAGAKRQLLGAGKAEHRELLAEALVRLGTERTFVIHGDDGLGEVTLGGTTFVTEASPTGVRRRTWNPDDFGLPVVPKQLLCVENPRESAEIIRRVLSGERTPARHVALANAAATLLVADRVTTLLEGAEQAAIAIDSGAAANLLERWAAKTREAEPAA
jgi:anthranilate phosphoribosyltransferase